VTIGIAAFGPQAGRAILEGLAAAERAGHGAIGGFLSVAVLAADGSLRRAETQTDGTRGLGNLPEDMRAAPVAALMSSAPNRPEPLAQFVAGASGVGLVTGHRFPNMPGWSGVPLNRDILNRMAAGISPAAAVAAALAENEDVDAGVIAIDPEGRLGSADTRRLERLADRGSARLGSRRGGALVAVRHNGIRPSRGLAWLVADIALTVLHGESVPDRSVELRAGVPVVAAASDQIMVDGRVRVTRLEVSGGLGAGTRHIGMGGSVPVFDGPTCLGFTTYEPFLVVRDGMLISADGKLAIRVPVRHASSCTNAPPVRA
jgi:hypothetical protein